MLEDTLDKINKAIPTETTDEKDIKIDQLNRELDEIKKTLKELLPKKQEVVEQPKDKTMKSIKEDADKMKQEKDAIKNEKQKLIDDMNENHLLLDALKEIGEMHDQDYLKLIEEKYGDINEQEIVNQNKIFKMSIIQLDPEISEEIMNDLMEADDKTIHNQFKISHKRILAAKGSALKENSAFTKKIIDKGFDLEKIQEALMSGDREKIKEARDIVQKTNAKEILLKELRKNK